MPKRATAGATFTTSNSNTRPACVVEDFAEDVARILDSARAKAEGWIGQRDTVVKHLTDIRDTATHLLSQIGPQPEQLLQHQADAARSARSQTNPASNRTPDRPRGRSMSAETRARMAEAQQRRWAAQRQTRETEAEGKSMILTETGNWSQTTPKTSRTGLAPN
jgi:hypothetical protein